MKKIFQNRLAIISAIIITLSVVSSQVSLQPDQILSLAHIGQAWAATLTGLYASPATQGAVSSTQYAIKFNTTTTGTIKTVNFTFPTGYSVGITKLFSASGIGAGVLSVSGQSVIYTVNSPVSISAGTPISFLLAKIVNPFNPILYSITVTTKDTGGATIDTATAPVSIIAYPAPTITDKGSNSDTGPVIGNVGIAASNPVSRFQVNASNGGNLYIGDYGCSGKFIGMGGLNNFTRCLNYAFGVNNTNTNTYINRPTGSKITFNEGNSPQVTITSGGTVGIGTTTPQTKLDVAGDLRITGDLTSPNTFNLISNGIKEITLNKTGNVGIGTSKPAAKLEVNGTMKLGGQVNLAGNTFLNTGTITFPTLTTTLAGQGIANDFGTATQTFGPLGLIIRNPTSSFATTISNPAITANRTLNLPLINGTDTLASLGKVQTFTANQTFANVNLNGNIASTKASGSTFKITAPSGVNICIGTGC